MATKTRSRTADTPGKGHNSEAIDVNKELKKIADEQIQLDKQRRAANAKFSEKHISLTGRIKALGKNRKNFNRAYEEFFLLEMAKDDKERTEIRQQFIVDQADYHEIYKALNKGGQINFLDAEKQAKKIREERAVAEGEAEEEEEDV